MYSKWWYSDLAFDKEVKEKFEEDLLKMEGGLLEGW
eukprot:CAMPEP_0170563526 /NCGR_PEP_ID=MMETSP0211-20121228/67205_1 /TAXON_ID=311385 /ORGANISM="Pseudokeronopsis sp., Strain OXSARD2" /LENGTH=35 /DNA_ID= /DNA_START= /DNA_END= /DNA_ORIENTATION=